MEAAGFAGRKFGRWTILSYSHKSNPERSSSDSVWLCLCECGVQRKVQLTTLTKGRSQSCGCLKREKMTVHGLSRVGSMYGIWAGMVNRCTNPKHERYADYGGRGITVCDRWLGPQGVTNFIADMGERPEGLTVDRKDNDKGYSPDNCRWATYVVQNNNRRPRAMQQVAA